MAIVSSGIKIYTYEYRSEAVAELSGTTSLSQVFNVRTLSADTAYYAVAEATDSNGLTGYSTPFQFRTTPVTYRWYGLVTLTSVYDLIDCDVQVSYIDQRTTFTECGIEFADNPQFTGELIVGVYRNSFGGADGFVGEVGPCRENTTYYYRYFATSVEYGTQYYVPNNNTITTNYAPPVLSVYADNVGDTSFRLVADYQGNYPVVDLSLSYKKSGGTETFVQLQQMSGTQYEMIYNVLPNTVYTLNFKAEYYENYITTSGSVRTLDSRPVISILDISDIGTNSAEITLDITR